MEPSSSFEANAASNHNRAEHTDQAITGMDPTLYEAAAKGNIGVVKNFLDRPLDRFLTVNKNTILHIFISSIHVGEKKIHVGGKKNCLLFKIQSSIFGFQDPASAEKFVRCVLELCPLLSLKANAEEETALHIAARYGHVSIVEVLISTSRLIMIKHEKSQHQDDDLESGLAVHEAAKKMLLGWVNKKKDTALHEAVRNNHIEVAKLLMKEDPDFSYGANAAGETPLYLAAERHFADLVSEILGTLKSPTYDGPLGRTALHAAAFYNDEEITKNILARHGALSKQADRKGWTPLHLAAYMNNIKPTQLLLKHDRELAYIKDVKGRTALHIAAQQSNIRVTEEIVSICPDCSELVDQKGRNALHDLAAKGGKSTTVKMIQKNGSLRSLLNQKDADGNTPLHIYCNSFGYDQELMDFPGVDKRVFNKNSLNAYEFALTSKTLPTHKKNQISKSARSEESKFCLSRRVFEIDDHDEFDGMKSAEKDDQKLEVFDKVTQAHMVVAVLITTLTFAAGITMPGGFVGVGDNQPPGSPVLWDTKSLEDFLFYDSISMVLSFATVLLYLRLSWQIGNFPMITSRHRKIILNVSFVLLYLASMSMMLAFFTATSVVKPDSKLRRP